MGTNAQRVSYVPLILLALKLVFIYGEGLGKELELLYDVARAAFMSLLELIDPKRLELSSTCGFEEA